MLVQDFETFCSAALLILNASCLLGLPTAEMAVHVWH
jgi:hypothetical protein